MVTVNAWIFVYASYRLKWPETYCKAYQSVCKHLLQCHVDLELAKERKTQIKIFVATYATIISNAALFTYDAAWHRDLDVIYGSALRNLTFSDTDIEYIAVQAFGYTTLYIVVIMYGTQLGFFLGKAYQLWHIFYKYNQSVGRTIHESPKTLLLQLPQYIRLHSELRSLIQLGNRIFSLSLAAVALFNL